MLPPEKLNNWAICSRYRTKAAVIDDRVEYLPLGPSNIRCKCLTVERGQSHLGLAFGLLRVIERPGGFLSMAGLERQLKL